MEKSDLLKKIEDVLVNYSPGGKKIVAKEELFINRMNQTIYIFEILVDNECFYRKQHVVWNIEDLGRVLRNLEIRVITELMRIGIHWWVEYHERSRWKAEGSKT